MTEPNGHVCPECAAPRTPDGTPSCGCTRRASDALRDARTAEAAAAEDFDPLRIRPYVDLTANESGPATVRLRTVPSEALSAVRHVDSANSANEPPYPPPASFPEEPPRRRRRTALLAVTGAAVAVVAAAGFASGLFSYDAPARERALPDDVRASVPDPSPTPTSPSPRPGSGSGSAPESAAPSTTTTKTTTAPSPSPSGSPSPSASATRSQPPTSSPSATPTPTPTAAASLAPGQGSTGDQPAQTLRRGDRGSEVTELQLRLRQLSLYTGQSDGTYSRQVEDAVRRYQWARGITGDKSGVYGTATRASLEGETRTP
ncbi:peptidoglycan-binding domain-containing protein [Streptomyces mirabilis]|uniref:peptidoglycan-binding domain-containing protein n=1 Tax=Streptomyces mirabilis TaxID=68239 RepID=UPI002E29DE2A|nr:peptidoglycan-binding domain-containing protein [Streptomyces mirabilis]